MDIVEQLREQILSYDEWARDKCVEKEAATTIETLRNEVDRLLNALIYHQEMTRPIEKTIAIIKHHRQKVS